MLIRTLLAHHFHPQWNSCLAVGLQPNVERGKNNIEDFLSIVHEATVQLQSLITTSTSVNDVISTYNDIDLRFLEAEKTISRLMQSSATLRSEIEFEVKDTQDHDSSLITGMGFDHLIKDMQTPQKVKEIEDRKERFCLEKELLCFRYFTMCDQTARICVTLLSIAVIYALHGPVISEGRDFAALAWRCIFVPTFALYLVSLSMLLTFPHVSCNGSAD